MTTELSEVVDQSTKVVPVSFLDEEDAAVTPIVATVTWSLYNERGTLINERENEAETSALTVNIVLSGDDLKHEEGSRRIVVVKARYNSSLGSNLPIVNMASFSIKKLIAGS
jgi:hypothetical protein